MVVHVTHVVWFLSMMMYQCTLRGGGRRLSLSIITTITSHTILYLSNVFSFKLTESDSSFTFIDLNSMPYFITSIYQLNIMEEGIGKFNNFDLHHIKFYTEMLKKTLSLK